MLAGLQERKLHAMTQPIPPNDDLEQEWSPDDLIGVDPVDADEYDDLIDGHKPDEVDE